MSRLLKKRARVEPTIKTQLGSVYTKLKVPDKLADKLKRDYLMAMYCDIVHQVIPDEESLDIYDSRKKLREVSQSRQANHDTGVLSRVLGVLIQRRAMLEPTPRPRIRPLVWLVLGIGVIATIAVFWASALRRGEINDQIETIPTTPIAFVQPPVIAETFTPEPEFNANPLLILTNTFNPLTPTPGLVTVQSSPSITPEPSLTSTPPPPEPTNTPDKPTGYWAVRAYRTDDGNLMLLNNHIVGLSTYGKAKDTGWIDITKSLLNDTPNYVTFVNLNGPSGSIWGFSLRQNQTVVWGNEGTARLCHICYVQTVQIQPDNTISEINLRDFEKTKLSGDWSVRAIANNSGIIVVNGVPTSGSLNGNDWGWVDISGLLYTGQENYITSAIWNTDGGYSWDFSLRKGETIIWGSNNSGSGQIGEVFFTTVIVDGDGNLIR